MAFTNNSSNTISVTAKLTPIGRQKLLSGSSTNLITKFALGDSDANYFSTEILDFGEVPTNTGDLGFENTLSNSVFSSVDIKNKVYYNENGVFYKNIEPNSSNVFTTIKHSNIDTFISNSSDFKKINILDFNNSDLNLLKSIYQPITTVEQFNYTGLTNNNGGFLGTTFSDIRVDDVLLINISGNTYGELINGRNFKVELTTSGGTYNLFSTFQKSTIQNSVQDVNIKEVSAKAKTIGDNLVFLFSDEIQKPNSDSTKSWSTGFNSIKPFSVKGKEFFNLTDNSSLNLIKDKMVGYVLLDKGFVVITNQQIINEFNELSDSINLIYGSIFTDVSQEITCIVNRGEFSLSSNSTYSDGENIRISEIGLYDSQNNLIAIGKINKHLELAANQYMAISVKITV